MTITRSAAVTGKGPMVVSFKDYMVITSNDSTTTINGYWLRVDHLPVRAISATFEATDAAVASTTAYIALQGTMDTSGTLPVNINDSSGNAIQTTAVTIGAATTTSAIGRAINTTEEGVNLFPFEAVRVKLVQGGATKGFTGKVHVRLVLDPGVRAL